MTHVNNAEGAAKTGWQLRPAVNVAPAAGDDSVHRFLATEENNSSCSHVDAVVDATAKNCLEECSFVACQTRATSDGWRDDFCITEDELEYEDELELSAGCSATTASTSAATPAHEYGLLGFGLGEREQQNEQLLMEGILVLVFFF